MADLIARGMAGKALKEIDGLTPGSALTLSAGDGIAISTTSGVSTISVEEPLPKTSAASVGDVLTLDRDSEPYWATPTREIPSYDSNTIGKVLGVQQQDTRSPAPLVELAWVDIPQEVPDYSEASEGDVLSVNSRGDLEWNAPASGGGTAIRFIRNNSSMTVNNFSADDKAYIYNYYSIAPEDYPFVFFSVQNVYYPIGIDGNCVVVWCPRTNQGYGFVCNNNTVVNIVRYDPNQNDAIINPRNLYILASNSPSGYRENIADLFRYIKDNYAALPSCPTTTDGTYMLQCVVSSGAATYSWNAVTTASGNSF